MVKCLACGTDNRDAAKFCSRCGSPLSRMNPTGVQPGQVMDGRYRIVRPLSKGGMGAIHLVADQAAFGRQRVLKEMLDYVDPADYASQAEYQQAIQKAHARFEDEARALASLKHRGIPDIISYFSANGRNYIVMEYVEGTDLEKRLTHQEGGRLIPGKPYSVPDVIRFGVQICRVLEYLAGLPSPMVHQDIKPANLIVEQSGDVRLVDFGTAKARMVVQPGGKLGLQKSSVYGTVGYAPPEQYQGRSEPRSDVYALAATLYHLLTDDDPRSHLFAFPRLSALPQNLWGLLDNALQHDVSRRPNATQLRSKLEMLLAPQFAAEPFYFRNGTVARSIAELVQACDQHWDDARFHLFRGDFEERLRKWGRTDLEAQVADLRKKHAGDQDIGLDSFLRLLDPNFPLPQLQMNPSMLQAGSLPWGRQAAFDLEIRNAGSGCLCGHLTNMPAWVQVTPDRFAVRDKQVIQAMIHTGKLAPHSQPYVVSLALDAGLGGQAQLPVSVSVPLPYLSVDRTKINLGTASPGVKLTSDFAVQNSGGSAFDVKVSSKAPWVSAVPARFRCEPGCDTSVHLVASTHGMTIGHHVASVDISAEAGGWAESGVMRIELELPWLKTLAARVWSAAPRYAAGLLIGLMFFVAGLVIETDPIMALAAALFIGGWLGLAAKHWRILNRAGCAFFLVPWACDFRSAAAGSSAACAGVWIGSLQAYFFRSGYTFEFLVWSAVAGLLSATLWRWIGDPGGRRLSK